MSGQPSKPNKTPRDRAYSLPRLPREYYRGDAVVHWTLASEKRTEGWLNPTLHSRFRELMLHVAVRENLLCPAYCLMPDHIHLVWMSMSLQTDQIKGMAFLRTYLEPLLAPAKFQKQAHDSVLRQEDRKRNAFQKLCFYVVANPVRAELVKEAEQWQYCGAVVPGYPDMGILDDSYWQVFWKLHGEMRQADAGNILRPPFDGQNMRA